VRFEHQVAAVIDAGACAQEPTTVVDLTGGEPELIRLGRGDPAALGL
jgi:tRNA A37 threonylcarbamoyladenosine synthetase subunit TsaC/SUA5/YrdC